MPLLTLILMTFDDDDADDDDVVPNISIDIQHSMIYCNRQYYTIYHNWGSRVQNSDLRACCLLVRDL